jgi:hypothetical protein
MDTPIDTRLRERVQELRDERDELQNQVAELKALLEQDEHSVRNDLVEARARAHQWARRANKLDTQLKRKHQVLLAEREKVREARAATRAEKKLRVMLFKQKEAAA